MRWIPGGTFAMGSEGFYVEERVCVPTVHLAAHVDQLRLRRIPGPYCVRSRVALCRERSFDWIEELLAPIPVAA